MLTPQMVAHLLGIHQNLAWLVYIERPSDYRVNFANNSDGWTATNATLSVDDTGMIFTGSAGDPRLQKSDLSVVGADSPFVIIDIERIANSADAWQGTAYYGIDGGHGYSESYKKSFANIPLGTRAQIVLDMRDLTAGGTDWTDSVITSLRFDFDSGGTGKFRIHSVIVGQKQLYFWSGNYHMTYAGNTYYGYGYLTRMESVQKHSGTEHTEQVFEFSGLKTSIVGEINTSVRGLSASIWLAGMGADRQVIRDPMPVSIDIVQDTLGWSYKSDDGTIVLKLTCFEALPFLGRALSEKWSYEGQLEAFPNDTGFKYCRPIAMQGPAVPWTL